MTSATGDSTGYRSLLARAVLLFLLAFFLVRLVGFAVRFGAESLQMDLAAYYTAGRSVQQGLSPYVNHVLRDPPIWDGVNVFRHSRFLYPPLVAAAFRPLAALPYAWVKLGWMVLVLAALVASLGLAVRLAGLRPSANQALALAVVAAWFYPVLALLERGQVDALTLLLLLGGLVLMRLRRARASYAAGALIALATLIKLPCAFLLPFLALRRRWRVVLGFVAGGLVLLGFDLAISGPRSVADYALHEMPRIARYGEGGPRALALPDAAFRQVLRDVPPGRTVLDGRHYAPSSFRFVLNAGLPQALPGRLLRRAATAAGLPRPRPSLVALAFLAAFLSIFALRERRRRAAARGDRGVDADPATDAAYWLGALVAVLLCGPVSWAMGAVWLLAVVPLVLREIPRVRDRGQATAVGACVVGLLLVGAPDPYGFPMLWPFAPDALHGKYVFGELLCLAGLLGLGRGDA